MRKFKFMSKAVVGMMAVAMTMGSLSGVAFRQPMAVYATDGDDTGSGEEAEIKYGEKNVLTFEFGTEVVEGNAEAPTTSAVPNGYSREFKISSTTFTIDTGLSFDSATGKVYGTPTKVLLPTTYTVTMTDSKSEEDDIVVEVEVTISVKAKDIELTAPTLTDAKWKKGTEIEPIPVALPQGSAAGTVKDYTLEKNPSWLEIAPVTDEDDKVTGYELIGTPNAASEESTGYITAVDENENILAWVEVNFPVVEDASPAVTEKVPEVDYEKMTLTFTTTDPYFTVDVLKDANDVTKASKTYTYTGGKEVTIDLGFLKLKKPNELNIYGSSVTDKTKGNRVTIAKQPNKEKLKIEKENVNKSSLWEALKIKDLATAKTYQYRSTFGSDWKDIDGYDYGAAKVAGTTIIVRKKAVTVAEAKADTTGKTEAGPAGPEVKVKIAAAAKAPSVKIAYDKGTIGVKKSGQVIGIAGMPSDKFVTPSDNNLSVEDIVDLLVKENQIPAGETKDSLLQKGFSLVVIARKDGKADSNPALVPISGLPQKDAANSTESKVTINGKSVTLKQGEKDTSKVMLSGNDVSSFEYQDANGKWKKATTKEIAKVGDGLTVRLVGSKEGNGTLPSAGVALKPEAETPDIDTITVEADGSNNPTDLKAGTLKADQTFKFKATAKKGTETVTEGVKYTWKIKDPDGKELKDADGFTWDGATLKIATNTELVEGTYTVHAECGTATVTPAQIVVAAESKVFDAIVVTLAPSTTIYNLADFKSAIAGTDGIKVIAKATNSSVEVTGVDFTWSIQKDNSQTEAISVDADGKLTIVTDSDIVAGIYKITAKAVSAGGTEVLSEAVTITLN